MSNQCRNERPLCIREERFAWRAQAWIFWLPKFLSVGQASRFALLACISGIEEQVCFHSRCLLQLKSCKILAKFFRMFVNSCKILNFFEISQELGQVYWWLLSRFENFASLSSWASPNTMLNNISFVLAFWNVPTPALGEPSPSAPRDIIASNQSSGAGSSFPQAIWIETPCTKSMDKLNYSKMFL